MNNKFLQPKLNKVTPSKIREAMTFIADAGHSSHAPLGCSGDTFILYGDSRSREVSLRLHSGDIKLLITDSAGNFLFYGGYDLNLMSIRFMAKEYHKVIKNVKHLLDNVSSDSRITEDDKDAMLRSGKILSHLARCF